MDNYLIRIYRRDPDDPGKISRLLDTVGTNEEKVFTCLEELLIGPVDISPVTLNKTLSSQEKKKL
jgi:hypothetical protein